MQRAENFTRFTFMKNGDRYTETQFEVQMEQGTSGTCTQVKENEGAVGLKMSLKRDTARSVIR